MGFLSTTTISSVRYSGLVLRTTSTDPKGLNRRPPNRSTTMGVNHGAVEDMARDVDENEDLYDALAINYEDVEDAE